ncbi:MAG: formate/nitrite transporter family protein [Lachnospiraceae bacterium]|nr:formate/nitrite transporter family protein [Lachnospiraceae bacterium]
MSTAKTFVSGILAGISIALGGVVFLAVENKVLGALLFTVGLFSVCSFGFHLFTGKVCYVFQNDKSYALRLPVIWLGNLVGTGLIAFAARLGRSGEAMAEKAAGLAAAKLDDSFVSLFFLGLLCNIFIYIAVEGYGRIPHEAGKYLALVFGVMGFILCGTEHCVADMFYFWIAGAFSGRAVLAILVITAGNCAGGVLLPLLRAYVSGGK